jgi:hypothetical protein
MSDAKRINGTDYSHASIKVTVADEQFYGFSKIAYADKRTRGKGYGTSGMPRTRTAGKYEVDPVTISGPRSSIDELRAKLASLSSDGVSFGDIVFQIQVQWIEDKIGVITDEIQDCVFVGQAVSSEETSVDPTSIDVEIDAMRIVWDGKRLFREETA